MKKLVILSVLVVALLASSCQYITGEALEPTIETPTPTQSSSPEAISTSGGWTTFTIEDGLASNRVTSVIQDNHGILWIGSTEGLTRYDGNNWEIYADSLVNTHIVCAARDKQGDLWFGTWSDAAYKYNGKAWRKITPVIDDLRPNVAVQDIFVDENGNIWLAVTGNQGQRTAPMAHGVTHYDGSDWTSFLGRTHVTTIFQDSNGNIWFGSNVGVTRYDGSDWQTFTTEDGLADDYVVAICQDSQGNIWFGTWNDGTSRYDGGEWRTFHSDDGLMSNAIHCMLKDSEENLWFGSYCIDGYYGISRFDGTQWQHFDPWPDTNKYSVISIFEDNEGNIWFATSVGLVRYTPGFPDSTPGAEAKAEPSPSSAPKLPFEAGIGFSKDQYLPGEDILYGMGVINLSSGVITIDPFSPAMWIKPVGRDEAIYYSAAGNRTHDIGADYPESWYHTKGYWDQKDANGEQVPPGRYEMGYEYVIIEQNTGERYTATPTARFQIVNPDSAMNKYLEVNQSVTAEGITVTLKNVELNAVEVKIYTSTTPPGYSITSEHPPAEMESLMINSRAEYSVDGGTITQVRSGGGKADASGITLTWDEIDPVPIDARELTFTITRLGDWEGRWEFRVPLGEDSGDDQNVTVSQLVSQADRYNGQVVTLDAFYFYDAMYSNALADSVGLDTADEGKVVPVGEPIGLKRELSQELRNQLYTQESPSPLNTEYFGKLRVTGKFGVDDQDGQYYLDNTSTEVLAWTPPPKGATVPKGNLQIKIQEFSDEPLQDAEVVSGKQPDGQPELRGLTDVNGKVTFDDIKQGYYEFTVSRDDYLQMDIKVTVTGGRTADVAFHMARVGEAPDDLLPAPGMGPQYRANMTAVRRNGTHIVNPWPSIQSTEVTIGTPPNTARITYRDYIETEAGQTRNNMFIVYADPGDESYDAIAVALSSADLPSGITVTQEWEYHGSANNWGKTALEIEISPQVEPGEHSFNIRVEIDGEDYGTVPCTVKVLEP